jgi:hypothetical protein
MRMLGLYSPLLVLSLAAPAAAYHLETYEPACLSGDMQACNELLTWSRNLCHQGDDNACSYAGQVGRFMQQQSGGGGSGTFERGHNPYMSEQYNNEVQRSRGVINSYCSDPRMSSSTIAQLKALGFCN